VDEVFGTTMVLSYEERMILENGYENEMKMMLQIVVSLIYS
jgi:hypothetical protein